MNVATHCPTVKLAALVSDMLAAPEPPAGIVIWLVTDAGGNCRRDPRDHLIVLTERHLTMRKVAGVPVMSRFRPVRERVGRGGGLRVWVALSVLWRRFFLGKDHLRSFAMAEPRLALSALMVLSASVTAPNVHLERIALF